ncbi:hypothetical protein DFP83_105147 [Idiomarina fontislapidosi]|uniref:Uncharacterized protein n=2 Tax=Idiomarina fontislapidosi TaxID=263723 RepID=A0A432XYR1_9GAMM|nr:hypothetical protein DFP83_105147 [Idiomarina fontislapidosi]RUO53721.1 hypothetical protein CWE25_07480 [Idiomarina fontislapidosi]
MRENAELREENEALRKQIKQQAKDNARLTAFLIELPEHSPASRLVSSENDAHAKSSNRPIFSKIKNVLKKKQPDNSLPSSDVELLRTSDLFDAEWYLLTYPDVKQSGITAELHYVIHGSQEGRDPSPYFNSRWYLGFHKDVAQQGLNPLVHYLRQGINEGRAIQPSDKADS